jgi:hypothetical protein
VTRRGFWCEAIAHHRHDARTFWLGSYAAPSPRLAMRWLRVRAGHIADQLDVPLAHPVRHWLADQAEHERALAALVAGEMYTHAVHDDALTYLISARPLPRQAP